MFFWQLLPSFCCWLHPKSHTRAINTTSKLYTVINYLLPQDRGSQKFQSRGPSAVLFSKPNPTIQIRTVSNILANYQRQIALIVRKLLRYGLNQFILSDQSDDTFLKESQTVWVYLMGSGVPIPTLRTDTVGPVLLHYIVRQCTVWDTAFKWPPVNENKCWFVASCC